MYSHQYQQSQQHNIPAIEVYWSLVAKADKKLSKIRDLPYYHGNRYDTYFSKVFKVYTKLWKYQQENRQTLVEGGLKRWEIGDIASRIAQLYFGHYMRTSDSTYLSESYIFYDAILSREYFKDGMFLDVNIAFKQLRFLSRFLTVSLLFNRRDMLHQLLNHFKILLDECKRTFQETDFKEWKLVVQEISKFLKADTAFMNVRPRRYSVVLDLPPDSLPTVFATKRKLKLTDALLCSYHPNEIKFSELTLDNFRMLQCLEWEPSGSFYQPSGGPSSGTSTNIGQNGATGSIRSNYTQDITDPSLPHNPRKAILHRPSVTHFMAVLATICEELPSDGILLIYISASGSSVHDSASAGTSGSSGNIARGSQPHPTSALSSDYDFMEHTNAQRKVDSIEFQHGCLRIGAHGNGGLNCIFPCDLAPFTRRPLFLVIDSDHSKAYKGIHGSEKGELIAMLLSPQTSLSLPSVESSRHQSGSPFTSFLTAPLQAFILLIGFSGSDIDMDVYNKAENFLSSSLNEWGSLLATSNDINPVWSQILNDPILRRLILRFIFCRAVLALYAPSFEKTEFLPECVPSLLDSVLPSEDVCQTSIFQLASIFGATSKFVFSKDMSVTI
ncbi:hypothetical protein LIER_24931 [Lithospermum erythrorhizon]|uniref:Protein SCAI n=1 Tax=Lithospermum erythrorhizon TaxID=34254 RepID=A0AAV3R774_LITER